MWQGELGLSAEKSVFEVLPLYKIEGFERYI